MKNPTNPIDPTGSGKKTESPEIAHDNEAGNVERPSEPLVGRGGFQDSQIGFVRGLSTNALNLMRSRFVRMDNPILQVFVRGLNRNLQDKRAEDREGTRAPAHERTSARESEPERESTKTRTHEIKDGKIKEAKEKRYENFLAERKFPVLKKEEVEGKEEKRVLSDFEKLLVERFELAQKIEKALKEGKIEFLEKTVEQWRAFFAKFSDRTTGKKVDLAEIDQLLFRGLVKKGDAKAVMISDVIHASGKTDKFARFSIIYQKISDLLSKLSPGDKIPAKAIAEGLLSEELMYLSLNPPSLESEILTGAKPKQGIFASESTEARVAEELGINMDKGAPSLTQRGQLAKAKKRKMGGFGGFFGGDETPVDDSGQFIPWWRWGNLSKPGGLSLKRAFYSGVIIIFVLVILFLIDRYLLGK